MAEVIYFSRGLWRIERQPEPIKDPMVVRFLKGTSVRKLLDQNARWTPAGWDSKRWVPRSPIVPKDILELVEAHMLTAEV